MKIDARGVAPRARRSGLRPTRVAQNVPYEPLRRSSARRAIETFSRRRLEGADHED